MNYYDSKGALVDSKLDHNVYKLADAANLSVRAYVNRQFQTDTAKYGQPFDQMLASCGLVVPSPGTQADLGIRAPTMADILSGKAHFQAGDVVQQAGSPYGQQSRTLFPAAIIAYMETALVRDYDTDANIFDKMIAQNISVAQDTFEQPQINMSAGGNAPNSINNMRAQRRSQLDLPQVMMSFTTSDVARKIPSYALAMEFSKEALRATTLDLVGLAVKRQTAIERDGWVYSYISDIINGDLDINSQSLAALGFATTTVALDSTCPAGTITQTAWLKWLARNRKYRRLDFIVCDLATYLKIEGRTGRPSLTAIDTIIPRLEAQAKVIQTIVGDVQVFIVDDYTAGGPLPAGTILGVDSRYGMVRVTNTSANVTAAENYALRQAEGFMIQHGEIVYRLHNDAFDVLTVS